MACNLTLYYVIDIEVEGERERRKAWEKQFMWTRDEILGFN